jgi:hypothetical protein
MWFIPSRKKGAPPRERRGAEHSGSEGELIVDQNGQAYRVTSLDKEKLARELERQEPDSLDELFQGEYEPSVVNEVRQYEKPAYEEEASSLDPVDDIEEFVRHGFAIPPERYDEVQKEGLKHLNKLERLREPLEGEDKARVEQRLDLVKHRPLEDVRWLKHKAYYRSMEKIRAAKAAAAGDAAAREAYLASKGAPLDVVPAAEIDAPGPMQQQAPRRAAGGAAAAGSAAAAAAAAAGADTAAAEALMPEDLSRYYRPLGATVADLIDLQRAMEASDTSEWAEGWQTMDYAQHGAVRRCAASRRRRRALPPRLAALAARPPAARRAAARRRQSWRPPAAHHGLQLTPRPPPPPAHPRRQLVAALNRLVDPSAPQQEQEAQQQQHGESEALELHQLLDEAMGAGKAAFLASSVQGAGADKYTPEFRELQQITRRQRRQRSQQRAAFVLGLSGALGAMLLKRALRTLRGKPGGGVGAGSAASVASSAAPALA